MSGLRMMNNQIQLLFRLITWFSNGTFPKTLKFFSRCRYAFSANWIIVISSCTSMMSQRRTHNEWIFCAMRLVYDCEINRHTYTVTRCVGVSRKKSVAYAIIIPVIIRNFIIFRRFELRKMKCLFPNILMI